jgi:hypothetical protein
MEIKVNMYTTEELAQMLEIRKQMDALQQRYDAIVTAAAARRAAAHGTPAPAAAAPPSAVPKPEAPAHAAPRPDATKAEAPKPAAPNPGPAGDEPAKAGAAKADAPSPDAPPASVPKPDTAGDKSKGGSLQDATVAVLKAAGTPLDFESVFKKLEEAGAPLPAEKPKLVLRRILYDKNTFDVVKGKFTAR